MEASASEEAEIHVRCRTQTGSYFVSFPEKICWVELFQKDLEKGTQFCHVGTMIRQF